MIKEKGQSLKPYRSGLILNCPFHEDILSLIRRDLKDGKVVVLIYYFAQRIEHIGIVPAVVVTFHIAHYDVFDLIFVDYRLDLRLVLAEVDDIDISVPRADIELPDILVRIGDQSVGFLINDAVITPQPLVSLPSEYGWKSCVSRYDAVVGVTVAVYFADDRAVFYAAIEPFRA